MCTNAAPAGLIGEQPVILADGREVSLVEMPHEALIALQWHQEREFARQILAAPKGSPLRSDAIRHAYETVTRIYAAAWATDGAPLALGVHARYERLAVRLLERHRARGLPAGLLEIGFGSGRLLKYVKDAGYPVFGIEASPLMHSQACRLLGPGCEGRLHVGDFLQFNFPAGQGPWSLIYWNDVLEHVPPDEVGEWLRRIHDLLLPGGQLVTITPNWHMRPSDVTVLVRPPRTNPAGLHLKEYTLREMRCLLRQAGFRRIATPLAVTRQRTIMLGRGLIGAKCLAEPLLELLPFSLSRLACRGCGLNMTVAGRE